MDKTKILLRLEATVVSAPAAAQEASAALSDPTCERTDITELMLSED